MAADKSNCDLLIVMGSSLKVRPVALIPSSIGPEVPQILINREPLNHLNFDVELLGDCDRIVEEICNRLGDSWSGLCKSSTFLNQISEMPPPPTPPLSDSEASEPIGPDRPSGSHRDEACTSTSSTTADIPLNNKVTTTGTLNNRRLICAHVDSSGAGSSAQDRAESSSKWAPKKTSVADRLPDDSYLFVAPNRYIFKGAEVYEKASGMLSFEDSSDSEEEDEENSQSDFSSSHPQASQEDGASSSSSSARSSVPTSPRAENSASASFSSHIDHSSSSSNVNIASSSVTSQDSSSNSPQYLFSEVVTSSKNTEQNSSQRAEAEEGSLLSSTSANEEDDSSSPPL
jgi:NAD-dependent deacetylase sirtuin 1